MLIGTFSDVAVHLKIKEEASTNDIFSEFFPTFNTWLWEDDTVYYTITRAQLFKASLA